MRKAGKGSLLGSLAVSATYFEGFSRTLGDRMAWTSGGVGAFLIFSNNSCFPLPGLRSAFMAPSDSVLSLQQLQRKRDLHDGMTVSSGGVFAAVCRIWDAPDCFQRALRFSYHRSHFVSRMSPATSAHHVGLSCVLRRSTTISASMSTVIDWALLGS